METGIAVDEALFGRSNHMYKWKFITGLVLALAFLTGCGGSGSNGLNLGIRDEGQIVFSSERDGNTEIYTMDSEGKNQKRLTFDPAYDYFPRVSHDGRKIVFVRGVSPSKICVISSDGTNLHVLENGLRGSNLPSFSPDDKSILFSNGSIYLMDLSGSNVRRLTENPSTDDYASFSLDGKSIVFVSQRDRQGKSEPEEIFIMKSDGSDVKQLTDNNFTDLRPSFSRDGTRIVFYSNRFGSKDILTMKSDGSDVQQLTRSPDGEGTPAYSPTGNRITFFAVADGNSQIYTINSDGSNRKQLTTTSKNYDPDWGSSSP